MIRYQPFTEERRDADLGVYVTFGIRAVDERGNVVKTVPDVSTNRSFVTSLCERCTMHGLAPIHLRDVVEDSI